ncbi:hypothetical protein J7T55_014872 [Diaporthe amygdali]|uniref:uncharacterized protein n=1 Tax=Phomopsis amygdali TaxID=1214568 RepID=UPI0022FDCA77|nr:uncharacterized protein J7T55_014872 [Diaporthe amygdali]KAJ0110069.1 hypothetical protein J7T55_014872 [Diaporthe amygdali]
MVKIVVPSHSSRYIVTASDLAKYLRSLFGEGYDFQIEVLPKCQPSPAFIHWLTTINSIPMTFGILKARETSQMRMTREIIRINTQVIEELIQEQNLESEDVFCAERGCFQVTDISAGKIEHSKIDNNESFSNLLQSNKIRGTRIISISGQSTIFNLDISIDWTARLFEAYKVGTGFSRTLVSFGNGPHFAEACDGNDLLCKRSNGTYTLSYKLNYIEPNDRDVSERWSSRHLGVYHEHGADFDLYILVHCSSILADIAKDPVSLHDLILQMYVHHWKPYLRSWGNELSKMSNQAMVAQVAEAGAQSYVWLRRLRALRDRVDLASGHCTSNLVVIQSIKKSRKTKMDNKDPHTLSSIEGTVNSCIRNSRLLKGRIDNTIELISCTLTIHSQEETARLIHELKVLTEETSSVTKKLTQIAENSAHSGEIVRVITIVSAIYLPGSFATSVFGMNFFDFVEGKRRIAVAKDIYIFVAFWVGLTVLTGATFFWAYMRGRKTLKKAEDTAFEALRQDSTKLARGPLSSSSGYEKPTASIIWYWNWISRIGNNMKLDLSRHTEVHQLL